MQARTFALALAGLTLWLPRAASAHFMMVTPKSYVTTENGGKGGPPCGTGTPSNIVQKVKGGTELTITIEETTPHPGHYRIALIKSHDDPIEDPAVTPPKGMSMSAAIQNPPVFPVLADG